VHEKKDMLHRSISELEGEYSLNQQHSLHVQRAVLLHDLCAVCCNVLLDCFGICKLLSRMVAKVDTTFVTDEVKRPVTLQGQSQ
jgi:hypothetical protein